MKKHPKKTCSFSPAGVRELKNPPKLESKGGERKLGGVGERAESFSR